MWEGRRHERDACLLVSPYLITSESVTNCNQIAQRNSSLNNINFLYVSVTNNTESSNQSYSCGSPKNKTAREPKVLVQLLRAHLLNCPNKLNIRKAFDMNLNSVG